MIDIKEVQRRTAELRDKYRALYFLSDKKKEILYWANVAENLISEYNKATEELRQLHHRYTEDMARYIGTGRSFVRVWPSFGLTLNFWMFFIHYCKKHGLVFSREYKF